MAGGVPTQIPRIDLPGLEFASLSGSTNVSIQGRRRAFANSALTPVGAGLNGQATGQVILGTDFQAGSGIYLVDVWAFFSPGDPTGELSITAGVLRLIAGAGGTLAYQLGIPVATSLAPQSAQVIARDQSKLITTEDLSGLSAASGPLPATWTLQSVINVHNADATNPHSFVSSVQVIWHRVDGVLM